MPDRPAADYLRDVLIEQLSAGDASFDLMVQRQVDPVKQPIEDPGIPWDESLSRFEKIATLHIPRQSFDSKEQREFGDNLSYNPWRCLAEHRPLGGINRARRTVYEMLSEFRHLHNQAPRVEPTGREDFQKISR